MERSDQYRKAIMTLLERYGIPGRLDSGVEVQLVTDTEHDHYQIMHVGWQNKRRVYGCILHMDIRDGKIWIQHNGTESDVAEELTELGVRREHIVLGFHSPYKRQFTPYAVG